MLVSLLQPLNAYSSIVVTEFGITVFLQPTTSLLVEVSIIALQLLRESKVRLSDATVTLFSPLQPPNAFVLMDVTEFGMVMLVRLSQFRNA